MAAPSPLLTPPAALCILVALLSAQDVFARRCQDTQHQNALDINKVTGKWYVVEIVEHDPKVEEMSTYVQPKCPMVRLERVNATGSWLTLSWSEASDDVVYNLNVTDLRRTPGRWRSIGMQEGSMTRRDNYRHFEGVVLVLKAVEDHVVLTFCQRNPDLHAFTVLLSRDRDMPADDVDSVNKMVRHRELYLGLVKHTCQGGAAAAAPTATLVIALTALACLLLGQQAPS